MSYDVMETSLFQRWVSVHSCSSGLSLYVVYADVVEHALHMPGFFRGICFGMTVMVLGGISQRVESSLKVADGNFIVVRIRNEIHRSVLGSLLKQRYLIFQHDHA